MTTIVLPSGLGPEALEHRRELASISLPVASETAHLPASSSKLIAPWASPWNQRRKVSPSRCPRPEHATEPEHGDRLEELAHQLGLAAPCELVEQCLHEGLTISGVVASTTRGRSEGSSIARSRFCGSPSSTRMLSPPIARASGEGSTLDTNRSAWVAA